MIKALMNILGQLKTKCCIETRDIPHNIGLTENMVISKKGFIWRAIKGCPDTSNSTLGTVSVKGLSRSPRPAARIIATGMEDCIEFRLSASAKDCRVGDL